MSFFRGFYISITCLTKNKKVNKPSLRVIQPEKMMKTTTINLCRNFGKRASVFISMIHVKASMTIEATLVLPIFLFAVLSLISVFDIMKIKSCMDVAVAEAGNEIAVESYGGYMGDLVKPLYISYKIQTFLDENLSKEDAEKISKYIFVTDVSFLEEENILKFRVDYRVTLDFGMPGLKSIKLHTTYYGHNWLGYTSHKDAETMVYISDEATVYHIDKNCTYLYVNVREVSYDSVENCRNDSGHIYQKCGFCGKLENTGTVYITAEGKNYHNVENCIGLTRTIYTVPLSTLSYKKVCSRCGE